MTTATIPEGVELQVGDELMAARRGDQTVQVDVSAMLRWWESDTGDDGRCGEAVAGLPTPIKRHVLVQLGYDTPSHLQMFGVDPVDDDGWEVLLHVRFAGRPPGSAAN